MTPLHQSAMLALFHEIANMQSAYEIRKDRTKDGDSYIAYQYEIMRKRARAVVRGMKTNATRKIK